MLRIIRTEDGSQSLFDEELNETYHSTKGAQSESEYVFLKMGLDTIKKGKKNLTILEVGFGTGLNAWLTWKWANENGIPVHFYTLEPFPVSQVLVNQMDLSSDSQFQAVHQADWGGTTKLGDFFTIEKSMWKLEETEIIHEVECIFFDAFAPSKQPEVWSVENLQKCYKALKSKGILTTYCAQGQFKRNLAAVGFEVEVLPGALGKKEMVRGRK